MKPYKIETKTLLSDDETILSADGIKLDLFFEKDAETKKVIGRLESVLTGLEILKKLQSIEQLLEKKGVLKRNLVGARASVSKKRALSKSYKYRQFFILYTFVRKLRGWEFVSCDRAVQYAGQDVKGSNVFLKKEALEDIKRRSVKQYYTL